jgi:hypothetical protein
MEAQTHMGRVRSACYQEGSCQTTAQVEINQVGIRRILKAMNMVSIIDGTLGMEDIEDMLRQKRSYSLVLV